MVERVDTAYVELWGKTVGAISWLADKGYAVFEYAPQFIESGLDISPIHMGLSNARQGDGRYVFQSINKETYKGLPGLLADVLPDKFGNAIIDAWLARQGRSQQDFSPVERLCYTGRRGMGALEFLPAINNYNNKSVPVEITELIGLAQKITQERNALTTNISNSSSQNDDALLDILRVGTSAGGARPKAIIAMNTQGDIRSGQVAAPKGYEHWLIKFDGVDDLELGKPKGFGRIEYAYYQMALNAGIEMSESRLLEEGGRAHFMTRRFDRVDGKKIHMHSLCGMGHYDFNVPGGYGYEQAFAIMRKIRLPKTDAMEQFRRMVFNVIGRNQDDHTKNIAFLMDGTGTWRLSPAYDVTYSYNPVGKWTGKHQMTINGKQADFDRKDLITIADNINISRQRANEVIDSIIDAVSQWPHHAIQAGIEANTIRKIGKTHRLHI